MPTEDELYKELGALTKARENWDESNAASFAPILRK